jgi:hypothetical protein
MRNRVFKFAPFVLGLAMLFIPGQSFAHDQHKVEAKATAKEKTVEVTATVKGGGTEATDLQGEFRFKLVDDEKEQQIGQTERKAIKYGEGVSASHTFTNVEPGKYYIVARYVGKIKHGTEEKEPHDIKTTVYVEVKAPNNGGDNGDNGGDNNGGNGGKGDKDVNCSDFKSPEEAQKWFDENGYSATNDPHDLDRDGDGKACEWGGGSTDKDGDGKDQGEKKYEDGTIHNPKAGGPMPKTAIDQPTSGFIGASVALIGAAMMFAVRRRHQKQG